MNKLVITGENDNIIYLNNDTNIVINPNTNNHVTLIVEQPCTCHVLVESKSVSTINCISQSSFNLELKLEADATITWRNLIKATKELDFNINAHHLTNSTSHITLRGITEDDGSINYAINSIAPASAINASVHQDSKIIMLNNKPSTITPNLLIETTEIDASHGAVLGGFDEDSIFYLESRGINKTEAIKLLLSSFIYGDYFSKSQLPVIKKYLTKER